MAFNENTRVKIPAILHLCRLGYNYLSLSNATRDANTNIFTEIFNESTRVQVRNALTMIFLCFFGISFLLIP